MCAHAEQLDACVADFWAWARETRLMKWDTFEPALVMTVFTIFLLSWQAIDLGRWGSHAWSARYRLQPGGPEGKTHAEHSRKIWKAEGYGAQEFLLYLVPLLAFDWLYPRRVLPTQAPTVAGMAAEVLGTLVLYDALFTASHTVMHGVPWLFKRVHAKHHLHKHVRAREIFRLSAPEEVADTGCSILALTLTRAHPLSRAVYNVVIVFLLCEIHSGYDMPWQLCNVVPGGVVMGSRQHVEHHATGRGAYAKFFSFLDIGAAGRRRRRDMDRRPGSGEGKVVGLGHELGSDTVMALRLGLGKTGRG